MFAIKTWWLEKDLFTYDDDDDDDDDNDSNSKNTKSSSNNDLTDVGHYTQLVWAPTHKVGCGIHTCSMPEISLKTKRKTGKEKIYYSYICNYCPMYVGIIS